MALPSAHRLTRTRDFTAVREKGKSFASRCLILAILPRPDHTSPHAGFTTTKRIGNAVTRNKVRRRLRTIARHFFPHLTATHDIVTIAKYPAVKAHYADLQKEWEKLALRAGLLPHSPAPSSPSSSPKTVSFLPIRPAAPPPPPPSSTAPSPP